MKVRRGSTSTTALFSVTLAIALALPVSTTAVTHETTASGTVVTLNPLESGEYAPGVDWTRFGQILIHPVQIAYTTDFELSSPFQRSRFRPQDIERTQEYFRYSIEKKLGRKYRITTKPGPNVLRVDGRNPARGACR